MWISDYGSIKHREKKHTQQILNALVLRFTVFQFYAQFFSYKFKKKMLEQFEKSTYMCGYWEFRLNDPPP